MKPISTSKFRRFLEIIGCKYYRTKGSHEVWGRKDLLRPVIFRTHKKEIPPTHIRTNLKTLGMTVEEFEKIINAI